MSSKPGAAAASQGLAVSEVSVRGCFVRLNIARVCRGVFQKGPLSTLPTLPALACVVAHAAPDPREYEADPREYEPDVREYEPDGDHEPEPGPREPDGDEEME